MPDGRERRSDGGMPLGAAFTFVSDAEELSQQLAFSSAGTRIGYHVGYLAKDRYPPLTTLSQDQRRALCTLADFVLHLADAGWVNLLQYRLKEERFLYLLVVRPRRRSGGIPSLAKLPTTLPQEGV